MLTRIRRRLAAFLNRLDEPAAGAITPDRQFAIDDGVNYDMPLVIPIGATAEDRRRIVQAAVREASSVYHFQFDRPYLYSENLSLFPTADPLVEWQHQTRKEILARCHLAWERNPLAKSAVDLTTLFTVGKGMSITYRNKRVWEILEEFRTNPENGIEEYEKQFCNTLQIDGELFVQFHDDREEGQTVITAIPPWEIDWIETERGFARRVLNYHRLGSQTSGKPGDYEMINEDIPAERVLHATINKLSYEMRGRPELFSVLPWLKAYKDWLENRARQNHWRGSLLWDVKLEGATASNVAAKRAQYKQPPPPGSLTIHNEKETWTPLESKANAPDVAEDGKQIKVMAAVGVKLPLYMLSEGEDANKATATAQQLPALKKFEDFQDILTGQVWKPIYRRVLQNAIDSGILPEEVEEQDADGDPILDDDGQTRMVKSLEAFDVSAPQLSETDPKNLADALGIAVSNEWISDETATTEFGYDYRLERKKIEREKAERKEAAMQGRGTSALPTLPVQPEPEPPQLTSPDEEEPQEEQSIRREAIIQRYDTLTLPQHSIESFRIAERPTVSESPNDEREFQIEEDDMKLLSLPQEQLLSLKAEFDRQEAERGQQAQRESDRNQTLEELSDILMRVIRGYTTSVREADAPQIIVNVPEQPPPIVNVNIPPVEVNIPPGAIRIEMPRHGERMTVKRDDKDRIVSVEKEITEG